MLADLRKRRQESARPAGLARVNGTDDEHGLANRMRPASREHPTGRVHVSGSRGPEGTPRGLRPFQEPDQQQAAQELASEELRYRAGQLELVLDSPLQAPPSPYESTYAEQYGLQRHHLIWSKSSDGGEGKTLTTPSNVPTEIPSSNAEEVDSVPEEINDRLVPTEIPSSNAEEADSVPEEINDRLVPTEIPSSNAEEVDSVLEEVSDRLILHDLRQSSTQISEAQEQQAKKGSAVRKVGVLDAAEVTPTEAANEVHRRRSFNPRPPLMSRSSTLLRQEPNETSDADIKPRKGRALRSGPDFPDRNAPTMQGSLQTRVEIHGTPVVFKAGRNWHTMDQMHRHGGSFLLGSHGHVHSESREHASGRVIIAGHHPQGALHSRPRTGMSTHRSSSGIGQRRPQTSSKRQEPEALSADEIVNAAFISAFPVHKPPAKSIFPASRLELPAKLEEPLLQDSKIRDLKMQKVKTGVQPCPRLLNLENLVVNWTDWTVPPELSARRDPSRDRPESSRPANKTPLLQSEMRRSHTSHQAPSEGIGDNRPLTDRPSHTRRTVQRGRGNLSGKQDSPHFSTDRMRPQTTEGGVRKLLPSETNRAQGSGTFHHGELRPQTVGTHQKRRDASKSSKGDNPRPMTSEGAQHVGLGRTSPATEQAESDDGMSISDASSPTRASTRASKRGGSALWSNIVSHDDAGSFFYERALHLDQPDSPNKDSSSTDHGSMMKDRLAGQLDMDSSESGSRAVGQGVARVEPSISLHSGHVPLEWIGTKSYKDYIQDVESVVAKNSEADLSLVQDERVRQLVPGKIKSGLYSMPSKRSSLLTCGLIRTPSGYLSRTSSVNGQKSKTSLTVDGIKAMPTNESQGRSQSPKLSAKEAMEAARLAKAQVFIDLKNDLDAKIEDSKWGTREALGSEGGFADLIQCQEYTHQFENKYDVIKEGCNNFFGTHLKEEKQQHLLEGRAHTEATMEESKCYISAFYTNKLERFSDSNALATKDWSGMTRQEIMKHAEFLRELEYVKFKSNDLVARLTRQGREIVKRSNMKTISRIPSGASRVSDSGKKPSSNLTSQPHTKQHFGRTPSALSKRGFFRVFVLEAVDLPNLSDKKEFADTYVRCELRTEGNEYKRGEKGFVENTDIAWQSLSPSWKKEFEFDVPELREDISISLSVLDVDIQYGQQTSTDTLIGSVEIPIFKEGYQMMSAEQETTKWLTLYKDNREVVSNQRQSLGRNALIKLSMVFTRKDRMTFGTSAHRIQTAYRCHLARAEFGRRREEIEGLRNRDSQNAKIVEKLDREHMWDTYLKFCYEENAKPVSECKRQFAHRDSFKLDHYYVPFRAVCAICRMLVEVYPHGRLKNLELRYTGINSPGMVVLANAIRSGCTALNSLILTGNHFTQEANDVTQANHPITNRLGKGMSGCRAIADVINETTTLKRLSFASCRLGNEGLAEIAKALQVNRHVEFLDLSDTNEDPMTAMYSAATELGKMLAQNDDIIELQLHSVGFPGQSSLALLGGGKFTSTGLRLNASLRVLNISRNNLCRSLVANAALRDFLCSEYCFLEHLDLGYNHMDQHGVLVFADGLIGNNSLLHVILDGNELGVIGCRTLLSYRGRKTVMGTSNKGLSEQAKSRKPKSKVQVRMIFEKFDRDHSGAMDVREMGEFLDSLSNTDLGTAEKIIAAIDADNSGAIEFDEFYEWYMKTLGVEDDGDKPVEISLEHCGGYSNVKGFDPSDPNGVYRLVMSEPSSCSTLLCMMQMVFAGKAEFLLGTMKRIEEDEDDEHARNYNLDISDDPTSWTVPQDGVLLFEFGVVRPSAGLNDCVGSFIMNHLRDSYGKPTGTPEEREEALIACSGEDSFFRYKQIVEILKLLDKGAEADPKRQLTVMEERVTLVSRLYLRMVDKENYSKLLGRLNDQERAEVEERLGIVAFKFDPNNATGYHRLDLKRPYEREVMVRLIEIRNSQRNAIFNWKKHLNRASGGREDFELVFRNLKYAGDPLQYTNSYRVPEVGVIELDFVDIRKPDPKMAKAMGDDDFQMLMASLGEASKKPTTKASEIREASNRNFFTCLQLWKLLCLFDKHKADESTCRSSCSYTHTTREHVKLSIISDTHLHNTYLRVCSNIPLCAQ